MRPAISVTKLQRLFSCYEGRLRRFGCLQLCNEHEGASAIIQFLQRKIATIIVASLVACNYVMSMRVASNRIIMVSELPAISVTKHQRLFSCYKGSDALALQVWILSITL